MTTQSPFYATKQMFSQAVLVTKATTYEEWMAIPDELKAAALFVQYFDEITLAWHKTKSFYALEEDGVSTTLQYLEKNVPIIKDDQKRFSPKYIYRVAYNCMYCISHDIKRDRERWENETSNIIQYGEDTLDLFDTIESNTLEASILLTDRERFWEVVESLDPDCKKLVDILLDMPEKFKNDEKSQNLLSKLRDALGQFVPTFCEV